MLKIDDLEKFCEAFKTENTTIKKVLLLVDDDDYTKFVKSEKHAKNEALLITVLPSANLAYTDKDNFKFVNHLHFFIVNKMDAKSSYEAYVDVFKFTQPIIKELFDFIKQKTDNFEECTFKDFDLKKVSFDPVTDKARTYGYSMSIPLKTHN
ncbi:hypothetical protein [Tenacibaculum soleae]|uniref:hypothetical protein n=1 Tax=Tenacibaculum soleae TaxID=447689 RepID=UPI0023004841|nr:hypothetical protein [Tenacibaculum soleae]